MTFIEAINLTKQRINFTDSDDTIDDIIRNAINYAYPILYTQVQKKPIKSSLTKLEDNGYTKIYDLPDDFYSEVSTMLVDGSDTQILESPDYELKGGVVVVKGRAAKTNVTLSMYYINFPTPLSNDNDTLNLNTMYSIATTTYAAYMYYTHKKNTEMANLLLNEFNYILKNENIRVKKEGVPIVTK